MHIYAVLYYMERDMYFYGAYSSHEKAKAIIDSVIRARGQEARIIETELDGKLIATWSYLNHGEFYRTY